MEKFHKYCLSVLLVIICSNISAQASNGIIEREDCKQLFEIYSQLLNHNYGISLESCVRENQKPNLAVHQKQRAIDLIGKLYSEKYQSNLFKNKSEAGFSGEIKYSLLLKNFEKTSKENFFADALYFKTKVSKVRNKDYLSAIS